MNKHQPTHYRTPISLPERTVGRMSIRHRMLTDRTPIIGTRQAYTRGVRPVSLIIKEPFIIHELVEEGHGIWMTDLPEELNQIGELMFTLNPHGRVLVGGLGLGILARALSLRDGVASVTVIERDPDVIALCAQDTYRVIQDDIAHFLTTTSLRFNYYLLDTWTGTNEATWWQEVMPLRRVIRQRCGPRPIVHCWAEDIMFGQILRSLTGEHRVWYYAGLPLMNEFEVRKFLNTVGSPKWERQFGAIISSSIARKGAP